MVYPPAMLKMACARLVSVESIFFFFLYKVLQVHNSSLLQCSTRTPLRQTCTPSITWELVVLHCSVRWCFPLFLCAHNVWISEQPCRAVAKAKVQLHALVKIA